MSRPTMFQSMWSEGRPAYRRGFARPSWAASFMVALLASVACYAGGVSVGGPPQGSGGGGGGGFANPATADLDMDGHDLLNVDTITPFDAEVILDGDLRVTGSIRELATVTGADGSTTFEDEVVFEEAVTVGTINAATGDLTIEALSGGDVNIDAPNGRATRVGQNSGDVSIGRSAGTTTLNSDVTLASGKGISSTSDVTSFSKGIALKDQTSIITPAAGFNTVQSLNLNGVSRASVVREDGTSSNIDGRYLYQSVNGGATALTIPIWPSQVQVGDSYQMKVYGGNNGSTCVLSLDGVARITVPSGSGNFMLDVTVIRTTSTQIVFLWAANYNASAGSADNLSYGQSTGITISSAGAHTWTVTAYTALVTR